MAGLEKSRFFAATAAPLLETSPPDCLYMDNLKPSESLPSTHSEFSDNASGSCPLMLFRQALTVSLEKSCLFTAAAAAPLEKSPPGCPYMGGLSQVSASLLLILSSATAPLAAVRCRYSDGWSGETQLFYSSHSCSVGTISIRMSVHGEFIAK
jgi:hypothetical protein